MTKTILLTGATDGIGFETAKHFADAGHHVILHGRNPEKLARVASELSKLGDVETIQADFENVSEVDVLADTILQKHKRLDVLLNNAGVFKTANPITADGLDVRFVVNTLTPYHLTQKLLPIIPYNGRVINLSSAAQAPVELNAMKGQGTLEAGDAYAQSKLAITMWTNHMASMLPNGPVFIAVNPGSLLATKMVKEGYGIAGKDINIGAHILVDLALDQAYAGASGQYFDNDIGRFGPPHPDTFDSQKCNELVGTIETMLEDFLKA